MGEERERLFTHSLDMLCVAGFDGHFKQLNPAWTATLGWTLEELKSRPWVDFVHPDDVATTLQAAQRLAVGETLIRFENRYRCRDGSYRCLSWSSIPRPEEDRIYAVVRDITERKRVEEEGRRSADLFAKVFHSSPAGILITRISDGTILDANEAFFRMFEYSREEVIGHTTLELNILSPEERARLISLQLAAGGLREFELRSRAKSGRPVHLLFTSKPIDLDGEACHISTLLDITERKQAEEAKRLSDELFAKAFHSSPAGILITRIADGTIIDANGSFLRMFEFSREEVIGRTSLELNMLTPEERARLIRRQLEAGGLQNTELLSRSKSGRILNLLFSSHPVELNGEACHITSLIDITERKQTEMALLEAHRHATHILETMSDAFVTWDRNWLYTYVNAAAERTLGRAREEMLGRNILELFHPDPDDPARVHYERAMADRVPVSFEVFYPPLQIWTEVHVYPTDEGGLSLFFRDITERRRAEEVLRGSEARLNEAQRTAHIGSWRYLPGQPLIWSDEMFELFKLPKGEPPSYESLITVIHPEDREGSRFAAFEGALDSGSPEFKVEFRLVWPDGQVRTVSALGRIERDAEGQVVEGVGTLQDITERKHTEESIREAHGRLTSLSHRLLDIQETERRQLARELHDEIGQALTATKITLQSLQKGAGPPGMAARLADCVAIVDRAIGQVRSLSLELRPPLLDDLGLGAALRWLFDQHAQRADLRVSFTGNPLHLRFDGAVETAAFRVAQEALTNIIRHAGTAQVTVDLAVDEDRLHLRVCDDGAGFDVEAARSMAKGGRSLGLVSMEERAMLAGGGVEWISAPGHGTEVHAWFTLSQNPGAA